MVSRLFTRPQVTGDEAYIQIGVPTKWWLRRRVNTLWVG